MADIWGDGILVPGAGTMVRMSGCVGTWVRFFFFFLWIYIERHAFLPFVEEFYW